MKSTLLTKGLLANQVRHLPFPLTVILPGDETLVLHKALRVIPNKRLTAIGEWQHKTILVKLFFHPRKAHFHATRDKEGVQYLIDAHLLTPHLYYIGQAVDPNVSVLIFEYVEEALSFDVIWENAVDPLVQQSVLSQLITMIARQHEAGLIQEDMHLGNFMGKAGNVYSVDGDGIKRAAFGVVSFSMGLKNIAQLLAEMGFIHPVQYGSALKQYGQLRSRAIGSSERQHLEEDIIQFTQQLRKERLAKTGRDCTGFAVYENMQMRLVWARKSLRHHWPDWFNTIQKRLKNNKNARMQMGDASWVKEGEDASFVWVAAFPWQNRQAYFGLGLPGSAAAQTWMNAHALAMIRVPGLTPLAFGECGFWPWLGKRYVIFEGIAGLPLSELVEERCLSDFDFSALFTEVVRIFDRLIQQKTSCGLLTLTHFFVTEKGLLLSHVPTVRYCPSAEQFKREMRPSLVAFLTALAPYPRIQDTAKALFNHSPYIDSLLAS